MTYYESEPNKDKIKKTTPSYNQLIGGIVKSDEVKLQEIYKLVR